MSTFSICSHTEYPFRTGDDTSSTCSSPEIPTESSGCSSGLSTSNGPHNSPLELNDLSLADIDSLTPVQIDHFFQILASSKLSSTVQKLQAPPPPPPPRAIPTIIQLEEEEDDDEDEEIERIGKNLEEDRRMMVDNKTTTEAPPKIEVSKKKIKKMLSKNLGKTVKAPKEKKSRVVSGSSLNRPFLRSAAKLQKNQENMKNEPKMVEKKLKTELFNEEIIVDEPDYPQGEVLGPKGANLSRKRSATYVGTVPETAAGDEKRTSFSNFRQFVSNVSSKIFNSDSKPGESGGVERTSLLRPKDVVQNRTQTESSRHVTMTPDRDRRMKEIDNVKSTFRNSFHERRNLWETRSFKGKDGTL